MTLQHRIRALRAALAAAPPPPPQWDLSTFTADERRALTVLRARLRAVRRPDGRPDLSRLSLDELRAFRLLGTKAGRYPARTGHDPAVIARVLATADSNTAGTAG